MNTQIEVTFRGETLAVLASQARSFANSLDGVPSAPPPTSNVKTSKKTAAPAPSRVEPDTDGEALLADSDLGDDTETFLSEAEEIVELETPEETKPAKKAAKVAEKDVHAAALAHAKKHGKPATMKVLAKFKVKSILELKAEQYAAVIKALAV